MRYLIVLVLSLAAALADETNTEPSEIEPKNENRYYCLYVRPKVELTVTSAGLEWGKWIEKPGNYNEIPSPVGKVAPANGELRICSSGRQSTATGTTGHVVLTSAAKKNVKIWWSASWGGGLNHGSEQKSDEFEVTSAPNGYQKWIWNVVAK